MRRVGYWVVAIQLAALLTYMCIPCVMLVYAMANAQLDELVWEADAAEAAAEQIGSDFAVATAATTWAHPRPSRASAAPSHLRRSAAATTGAGAALTYTAADS